MTPRPFLAPALAAPVPAALFLAALFLAGPALAQGAADPFTAPGPLYQPTQPPDLQRTQPAWSDPEQHRPAYQPVPGYVAYPYDAKSTYPVRTRPGFSTTIRLDPAEHIVQAILADPSAFEYTVAADDNLATPDNAAEIRPFYAGVDTTLKIRTQTGRHYSFYVASVPENWPRITDLTVDIVLPSGPPGHPGPPAAQPGAAPGPGGDPGRHQRIFPAPAATPAPVTGPADSGADDPRLRTLAGNPLAIDPNADGAAWGSLEHVAFDPSRMTYDISAFASTPEAATRIAPVRVWRDDHWTYVDFGHKARGMSDWPAVTLVADGTETPVAVRVAGRERQILIVEAIGDIVLSSGPHVVCLLLPRQARPAPPPRGTAAPLRRHDAGLPPAGATGPAVHTHPSATPPAPGPEPTPAPAPVPGPADLHVPAPAPAPDDLRAAAPAAPPQTAYLTPEALRPIVVQPPPPAPPPPAAGAAVADPLPAAADTGRAEPAPPAPSNAERLRQLRPDAVTPGPTTAAPAAVLPARLPDSLAPPPVPAGGQTATVLVTARYSADNVLRNLFAEYGLKLTRTGARSLSSAGAPVASAEAACMFIRALDFPCLVQPDRE